MQKFIIPLLTVVMVVSITFAGCAPATPPELPEAPPITPTPPETPPEAPELPPTPPAPPTPSLPKPGEWNAATGATEFTFTFTVSPDGRGIPQYTYEFEEFGCGGYQVGKMTGAVTREPIPIHPLPSGAEFSFVDDQQVYTGIDPVTGTSIRINWHIVIEGKFDETGTQASGTWEVSSAGKVRPWETSSDGTTCQEGTWEASAP